MSCGQGSPVALAAVATWIGLIGLMGCRDAAEQPAGDPGSGVDRTSADTLPPDDALLERLDGDLAAALREARAAARAAAPDDAEPLFELGRLLDAHDLPAQAVAVYDAALERDPRHARAAFLSARARYELWDDDGALAALRAAIALTPERAPGHWRLGLWLAETGDFEGSRAAFDAALGLDPADASAWFGAARAELDAGEPAAALRRLEAAPAAVRAAPHYRHLLARALEALGRHAEASQVRPDGEAFHDWYDPWVAELDELRVGRGAELGEALAAIRAGRPDEAIDRLGTLLAERPDDVTVQGMFAAACASAGRPADALPLLFAAAERQPRHYRIALNLALNLQAAGRTEEALAQAERAVALHPEHATSRYQLGRLHERAGHVDAAVAAYRAALRFGYPRERVAPRLVRLGVEPEAVGP